MGRGSGASRQTPSRAAALPRPEGLAAGGTSSQAWGPQQRPGFVLVGPTPNPWVPPAPGALIQSPSLLQPAQPWVGSQPCPGSQGLASRGQPWGAAPLHLPPHRGGLNLCTTAGWRPPFPTLQGTGLRGPHPGTYPTACPRSALMGDGEEWGARPHGAQGLGAPLSGSQQHPWAVFGLVRQLNSAFPLWPLGLRDSATQEQ